ncbi:MAG: hypothetical protein DMG85_12655 [Acidobacteria bacterium]|nr:MAG: hypothetical protein DMG85_12655 [Acidobacteriota bacterium]
MLPYNLVTKANLQTSDKTGDIVHRFWHEQAQINHGKMNRFVTWSDNPGLVVSYFDATSLPEGKLAQKYTMDDNFFHAAFGGSFLNHQFLIAAAAPVYPNAPASMQPTLDASGKLALDSTTGKTIHDGNITPIGAPSLQHPGRYIRQKLCCQHHLFGKSGSDIFHSWQREFAAIAERQQSCRRESSVHSDNRRPAERKAGKLEVVLPANPPVDPLFQWHHQPFAYYDNYAPWKNGQRNLVSAARLQDETDFFLDLQNHDLPAVSFINLRGPKTVFSGMGRAFLQS